MKPNNAPSPNANASGGVLRWALPALLLIGVAGMSVTGTLLWTQSRPSTPAATKTAAPNGANLPSVTGLPNSANMPQITPTQGASSPHEPPATLTAGMPPAQTALTLGNWYFDHEAWPMAVENYRRAIEAGADNADVRTDYGSALRFGGNAKQALEQYQFAQKQNPQHENSLFNQGGLYANELKQPAKGLAVWREYLQKFPNGQSVVQARQLIAKTQEKAKP